MLHSAGVLLDVVFVILVVAVAVAVAVVVDTGKSAMTSLGFFCAVVTKLVVDVTELCILVVDCVIVVAVVVVLLEIDVSV